MQQLPPGHSLASASVPALGGFLQRVKRDSDGHELLARSANSDYAGDAAVRHLDAEFGACALDDGLGILRPAGRIDGHRQSWLLYEAVVGQPLDTSRACELEEFWEIAAAITRAVAHGHGRGRAHGRLEGNCIWWDPAGRRVGLLGMLPVEQAHLANHLPASVDTAPELLVTDRAKVSPAADVYSLGAIFYRLLSGRPALASSGNLAFEAAATPPAPLDPARVPQPVADLIARMLSKSPTSRPADAACVLDELQAIKSGSKSAQQSIDLSPRTLVGRPFELELLLDQARKAETGAPAVVRVAGEPGIGKSHLLAEFMRQLASGSRLVADGKFEQFHQRRPYSALLTACGNALSHALAAEDLVFQTAKQRLQEADPALLASLLPDIPEIEYLRSELPEATEFGPSDAQSQFKRAFVELLGRLCSAQAPLVLVLDDVQWADRATADLLVELIGAGLPEHLLLVLGYRDTAARQNPDLAELFRVLGASPVIALGPFDPSDTEALCRELVPQCEGVEALAWITHQRSHGNALHCVELLKNFMASGELARVAGRWRYAERGASLKDLSETVAELIRERLARESASTRRLLAAAACIGHGFADETLAIVSDEPRTTVREHLDDAVRRGFIGRSTRGGEYAFCHDRIQQVAREFADDAARQEVNLRLGRYYRAQLTHDRSALFPCLDHLNPVRDALVDDERHQLALLNFEGARRARASIAYERAIPLFRLYLGSDRISRDERFEATLLLTECLFLSSDDDPRESVRSGRASPAEQALEECAALATTRRQKLTLLYSRMTSYVHGYNYAGAVEAGLSALRLLGRPLPERPWLARAVANVIALSIRMSREDPDALAERPDCSSEDDGEALRFMVGLWGPSFWSSPTLNVLLSVKLMELTLRCGNGPHSSMAYGCFAAICHMQERYETAIRYGRVASRLITDKSPYTRAIVRFLTLTFFGVFEHPAREVLRRYGDALKEAVAEGEIVAAPIIDGAVTTLPHTGAEVSQVLAALEDYERQAHTMGAKNSREMIGVVRAWCDALTEGPEGFDTDAPRPNSLNAPLQNAEFVPHRDILRMQIEYLAGRDREVLEIGRAVRGNMLMKGNPLCKGAYALCIVLASTRRLGKLTRPGREALKFLQRLDRVAVEGEPSPATFRASLRLAQGVKAAAAGESGALELLQEAADLAAERGQGLVRAISLERLAHVYGARAEYALCVERIRDAARAYRRFGATAKADAIVSQFPGVDWTHLRPREVGIQVEGIMRAATAIVEATSTDELGSTLLRVIATSAGAMRAFLFAQTEGKLFLVAGCERDRADLFVNPTPIDQLDPQHFAIKPIYRVERSHEPVQLPQDRAKFLDDPYLSGAQAPRALLCVPLLYRGELVAILYLENGSNAESFSQDEIKLVTLLGKQAAIAMTNADNHRLEVEALQSKINPHFLYNALTVIAELVGRSPDEAEEAVYKLTRLYRYMVNSRANLRVSLEKELALVRDYLELERARFGDRLKVTWDIDSSAMAVQVPALLLQPLAENAVNHGVQRNLDGGTVRISARVEKDALLLTVSDTGPGWYEGKGGTGFGLKSVRRRLQLVYGNYAKVRIVNKNGVTVQLSIPI